MFDKYMAFYIWRCVQHFPYFLFMHNKFKFIWKSSITSIFR